RREKFIAQAISQCEFGSRLPAIHGIERMAGLEIMHDQRRGEVHAIHVSEQEIRQAESSARGVDSVGLQLTLRGAQIQEVIATLQILVSKFEAVAAFQPAEVLNNVPRLGNLELRPPRRRSDAC